eukprot:1598589-Rhodomonas_salina.2
MCALVGTGHEKGAAPAPPDQPPPVSGPTSSARAVLLLLTRCCSARRLALALAIIRPAGRSARRLNTLPAIRSAEVRFFLPADATCRAGR